MFACQYLHGWEAMLRKRVGGTFDKEEEAENEPWLQISTSHYALLI